MNILKGFLKNFFYYIIIINSNIQLYFQINVINKHIKNNLNPQKEFQFLKNYIVIIKSNIQLYFQTTFSKTQNIIH